RRRARGLQVHVVRRGVDDRVDVAVLQDGLVAGRGGATVFRSERFALVFGARVASHDLELLRALDRVGEYVRPPAHADAGDPQGFSHLLRARAYGLDSL